LATTTTIFQAFQPIFVVFGTGLGVAQNLVGRIDFLEFVFVSSLVGMVFDG
jgi:hypothetical protein